jgi:hypothetical protein
MLASNERWLKTPPLAAKTTVTLVLVVFQLMTAITFWLWAYVFIERYLPN